MPKRVAEIGLMPVIPRFEVNNRVLNTTNMDLTRTTENVKQLLNTRV